MSEKLLSAVWLLADAAGDAPKAEPGAAGGGLLSVLTLFAPLILLFYFLILRPERRKQSDHKSLLSQLKKNDRVVTIGGIYGIVANVMPESDRVSLKIDEASNTKIDVTFNAIARIIVEQPEGEK
ncbi:MAG TPA: preprotein translocase subunit YajC [Pirellulales bacterium]